MIVNQNDLSAKLDILSNHIISGSMAQHYFYILIFIFISLVLAISLGVWVSSNIVSPNYSFVVLTRKSVEYRKETLAKDKRRWCTFIFSLICSIITGLISDYLFLFLVK